MRWREEGIERSEGRERCGLEVDVGFGDVWD